MPVTIADPRTPAVAPGPAASAPLIELAVASLAAPSATRAAAIDQALAGAIATHLESGEGLLLAEAIAAAPSVAVARALWRRLIEAWALVSLPAPGAGVAAALFALPVVIVAGREGPADEALAEAPLSGLLADTEPLAALLRGAGALGGSQTFALANALVGADAIDVPQLGTLRAWQDLALHERRDLPPAPIAVQAGQPSVHLRFVVGSALVAGEAGLPAAADLTGWALPFARELSRQLAAPGLSVLALPQSPQSPPAALQHGRAAQREVGAQLFASNAIRKLRAATGEPAAVISAHRCVAAPGGGELRVSLSSPFDARQAEGFRCPLFPTDNAGDVAAMLLDLLHDCRIGEVHILPGVHADRDPHTGLILLFKAEAVDAALQAALH
jgi:hypothetical protein